MKKVVKIVIILIIFCFPVIVDAQRGCCSWHGGVAGCDSATGKYRCVDGTLSPSCTCSVSSNDNYSAPSYTYGCTNPNAINYNSSANKDDGSCILKKMGCTDSTAVNYDSSANTDDGTCHYEQTKVETKVVNYKKEYKKNSNIIDSKEKVIEDGKTGEKEVTYSVITDRDGKIISKKKISEKITIEPVTEIIEIGTKKETSGIPVVIWIIAVIIIIIYKSNHKQSPLLINQIDKQKAAKKILLYILYFIFIIPVYIDIILLIINEIKMRLNK